MEPNPYQAPVHGAVEARPVPRTDASLIRIGCVTALAGLLFLGVLDLLDQYLRHGRFWFVLAFFVSLAMIPIGTLLFTVGLTWWVSGWMALQAGRGRA